MSDEEDFGGMYIDHIRVTCDDDPEWRLPRIHRTIGYACAKAEQFGVLVLDDVTALHDHEGTLTVLWKSKPTEADKECFVRAWESIIGDGGGPVEHKTP